jgi:hypothetical protein
MGLAVAMEALPGTLRNTGDQGKSPIGVIMRGLDGGKNRILGGAIIGGVFGGIFGAFGNTVFGALFSGIFGGTVGAIVDRVI